MKKYSLLSSEPDIPVLLSLFHSLKCLQKDSLCMNLVNAFQFRCQLIQ